MNKPQNIPASVWDQLVAREIVEEKKETNRPPNFGGDQLKKIRRLIKEGVLDGKRIRDIYREICDTGILDHVVTGARMTMGAFQHHGWKVRKKMGLQEVRREQVAAFMDMYQAEYRKKKIMAALGLISGEIVRPLSLSLSHW